MIKLNGKEVEIGTFPNGECNYSKDSIKVNEYKPNEVEFRFEDNGSLMDLYFIMQHIRKNKGQYNPTNLRISYMPYSRMDRDNDDYLYTLDYLKDFFKTFGHIAITVVEPHSEVTLEMLNSISYIDAKADYISVTLAAQCFHTEKLSYDTILVMPDKGAAKRYDKLLGEVPHPVLSKLDWISMEKVRNFKTGQIESIEFADDSFGNGLLGLDAIIIDDLSSRGGTFLGTAAKLKECGVKNVYLAIAHAENAILEGGIPSSDLIKKVYTTDSIIQDSKDIEKIKIFR